MSVSPPSPATLNTPLRARLRRPVSESLFRQRVTLLLRNPVAVLGLLVIFFWIAMAVVGPSLRPYSFTQFAGRPWAAPSATYWFGTDRLGRDMFARIAVGARLMLILPLAGVGAGVVSGAAVGLVTGYFGGWVDDTVMRLMDILMAFPMMMLYLLVIFAIGPSAVNVVWAIAISAMPGIARLVRGLTIDLRHREFVAAAQMRGESPAFIMFREILPNLWGALVVDACVRVAYAMFATGALGFLGLGVPAPMPDWGNMIAEGRAWIFKVAWAPIPPVVAISSLVIALNLVADGMRKAGWGDA